MWYWSSNMLKFINCFNLFTWIWIKCRNLSIMWHRIIFMYRFYCNMLCFIYFIRRSLLMSCWIRTKCRWIIMWILSC